MAAVVNTGCGGLYKPTDPPEHVFFIEHTPYDWILRRVYAVIHHGGAGTTHASLRYGCPCLIIPHFLDQFYLDQTINKLGAGPPGIPISELNEANLEDRMLDLLQNPKYLKRASTLSRQMEKEADEDALYKLMTP